MPLPAPEDPPAQVYPPAQADLPPLVGLGPELSVEEVRRYSRHLLLPEIGTAGQRRLKNARVLVVGAGGLGSPALTYLAAAGVGTLGVVDFDVVEESNLQRQVIHGQSDIGRSKTRSARDSVREINPFVDVVLHEERLDSSNALRILERYDLVLDGSDTFATRYLVSDACVLLAKPCVWGSILRFDGQVSVFWDAAPGGDGVTYRDLYPDPPPAGSVPSCSAAGVLGALCAAIGSVMATEAVKLVTGVGTSLLGRVLVHDALAMTYRTVRVTRDPGRVAVTRLVDQDAECPPAAAGLTSSSITSSSITAPELAEALAARERGEQDFVLVDVRDQGERDIVAIPGSVLVPFEQFMTGAALTAFRPGQRLVLHCKGGGRSAQALQAAHQAGFTDAVHVEGGVLAWVAQVEPDRPTY